jgi:hypothetical protein
MTKATQMAGSPVPTARVTSARVAVDKDAPVRRMPQGQDIEVPIAVPRTSTYVPVHLRPYTVEGLRETAIREENAAIEREALMLTRDCSAREASTRAHETRRARQRQWEASDPPVTMDTAAVLSPGQEVLTHDEEQVPMVRLAMQVSRERAIILLFIFKERQRLQDEEGRIHEESSAMEEAAGHRRRQEKEQEELWMLNWRCVL